MSPLLVGTAQRYGEVVVARAYSEWQMTSERLAVYRAGVEPVYAPTFPIRVGFSTRRF